MARKKKVTLQQVVSAAKAAQVSVSLVPKPVSVEPILKMAATMDAIYHLANTRDIYAIRAAHGLLRHSDSFYNACQKILMDLEREIRNEPPRLESAQPPISTKLNYEQ